MSDLDKLIDQRDRAEEAADALASAIASHLGVDIGEHSNANDPWDNALRALEAVTRPGPLNRVS